MGTRLAWALVALVTGACSSSPAGRTDAAVDGGPDALTPDSGPDAEPAPLVWPNDESRANSDPWIAAHHDEIRQMRPRVLALNFVNGRTNAEMLAQLGEAIDAIAESSRFHGDADPEAPVFLQYEIAYAVDLTDAAPPPGWPYNNSTLYPREDPPDGYWSFDYEQLFDETFAALYGVEDPQEPGRFLTLCELIDRGLVHEVWVYGDADVPDVSAAEILELKPYYDADLQRRDVEPNRCAGNGCFDAEDTIPASCTRTVRVAWFNNTRGPGCFLESHSHGFESIGAWNPFQIPYLGRHFVPFAGYGLDVTYGLPFESWYACDYAAGTACLGYPTATSVAWDVSDATGLVDPYDPVCGNVHFLPNGRGHYDLTSPWEVQTTCRSYRRAGGATPEPFTTDLVDPYTALAPDCMGRWLVWWRQQVPGLDNDALDDEGAPMRNWWPFLFY